MRLRAKARRIELVRAGIAVQIYRPRSKPLAKPAELCGIIVREDKKGQLSRHG
jgi:hypothetical protein